MARGRNTESMALLLFLSAMAGCESTPELGGDPQLRVLPATDMPAPSRMDLTMPPTPYYVGAL